MDGGAGDGAAMTIRERTRELVQLCGTSVQARERIILSLMAEFDNITPDSAIQHIASAKRWLAGVRKGGRRVEREEP